MKPFPDQLTIQPLTRPPEAAVRIPGSKSITNRALVLAALAARTAPITLTGALRSEDTEVMVACLQALGFRVDPDWDRCILTVNPTESDRIIPAESAELWVTNSGTTMRFLTAMVSLGQGRYRLDGVPRMRERPIGDLLEALRTLGARAVSEKGNECPPVVIEAAGWRNVRVAVGGAVSSQFLSGLLLAAPFASQEPVFAFGENLVSRPYLDMTLRQLSQWGLTAQLDERSRTIRVPAGQRSPLRSYAIEPDASAASYFFAAAAISGGRVRVTGLSLDSLQGDVRFVEALASMGCRVSGEAEGIVVEGGPLRGIDIDMNGISDTVMTLGAVACFAQGPTTIRNVAHIRHKETDRLFALATELRKVGATVEERPDGLTIVAGPLHGAEIETYQDHRMAMSLALVGLRVPGVVLRDPGCVAKTYPDFFTDLEKLR